MGESFRRAGRVFHSLLRLGVIVRLGFPKGLVLSVALHQLLAAALLDNLPVVEHGNVVAEPAGGKPVADVHRRLVSHNLVEVLVHLHLRHRIQGGGGLIQHHEGGVFVQSPGQSDFLGFPAGHLHAAFVKFLVQGRFQALGHGGQPLSKSGHLQAGGGPAFVHLYGGGYVLPQGKGQQLEILEHHGEQGPILPVVVLADVDAV